MFRLDIYYDPDIFFFAPETSETRMNLIRLNDLNQRFMEGIYVLLKNNLGNKNQEEERKLRTFRDNYKSYDILFSLQSKVLISLPSEIAYSLNDNVLVIYQKHRYECYKVLKRFSKWKCTSLTIENHNNKWNEYLQQELNSMESHHNIKVKYKYSILIQCNGKWRLLFFNDLDFICGIVMIRSWLFPPNREASFQIGHVTLENKIAKIKVTYPIDVSKTYQQLLSQIHLYIATYVGSDICILIQQYTITCCVNRKNNKKLYLQNFILCETECEYLHTECAACRQDSNIINPKNLSIPKIEIIHFTYKKKIISIL